MLTQVSSESAEGSSLGTLNPKGEQRKYAASTLRAAIATVIRLGEITRALGRLLAGNTIAVSGSSEITPDAIARLGTVYPVSGLRFCHIGRWTAGSWKCRVMPAGLPCFRTWSAWVLMQTAPALAIQLGRFRD